MRALVFAGLLLLASAAAGLAAQRVVHPPAPAAAELAVETRLRCPQCTGTRLDVCDRQICADMRADIRRRLGAGEAPDAIVRDYAAAYGQVALYEPAPLEVAAAWVPWAALGLGLALLAAVLVAWHRAATAPIVTPPIPDVSASSALVDAELARWRRGQ